MAMSDANRKELKAYEVDYWIRALKGNEIFDCRYLDEKTEALMGTPPCMMKMLLIISICHMNRTKQ